MFKTTRRTMFGLAQAALATVIIGDAAASQKKSSVKRFEPWERKIKAGDFKRAELTDQGGWNGTIAAVKSSEIEANVRKSGNLGHSVSAGVPFIGWFEYEVAVPRQGWYTLIVVGGGGNISFFVDGVYTPRASPTRWVRSGSKMAGALLFDCRDYVWWRGSFLH